MSTSAVLRRLASAKINQSKISAPVLAVLLMLLSLSANAHMMLDPSASSVGFVSVKNGLIAEAHQFTRVSGAAGKGSATLSIDLTSVDTGIGIRDERMREFLFHTDNFPRAEVQVPVDMKAVLTLAAGDSLVQTVKGTLTLHGSTAEVSAKVTITRLADGGVQVATRTPLVLQASSFGLLEGLAKLQELASLNAITAAVPVTFNLVYRPAGN